MKVPAFLSVFFTILAGSALMAAASQTVTLQPSSLSYKQAIAACTGALGTVTFTLGHARSAGLAGVSESVDSSMMGIDTITFTDSSGKSATAVANGHNRTVSAKNVQVKWKKQLACIMPD